MQSKPPFSAIILAAGKGTRMKSALPKVLHQVAGLPLLIHVARACRKAGASRIYHVLGFGRDQVLAALRAHGESFQEVWQKEQLGTGHAMKVASGALSTDDALVMIVNGDGPLLRPETIQEMLAFHLKNRADITLGVMDLDCPYGYGRVLGKGPRVARIVEEKEATDKEKKVRRVNGGLYLVNRKVLDQFLPKLKPSKKTKELYFTDVVGLASKARKKVLAFPVDSEELLGVNDMKQLAEAQQAIRQRIVNAWMLNGVSVEEPNSVWVDVDAHCASGAILEANVRLQGRTQVESGARISTGSVLKSSHVKAGAQVHSYSVLEECVVGEGAQVGPFARIRPGTDIGEGAKLGNFVEVKKSRIGRDAKASHLAYIGDADVGEGSNLGCGFITCNYDGENKHRTVVGKNVFVGSDVQVVAPVEIGDGAYVAAGTTVTRNVPAGSLAIARQKQENKDGYADRIRSRAKLKKKD